MLCVLLPFRGNGTPLLLHYLNVNRLKRSGNTFGAVPGNAPGDARYQARINPQFTREASVCTPGVSGISENCARPVG